MMLPPELSLGPFKVDLSGMLSPSTPEGFPHFSVQWRGRVLHTGMRQTTATDADHGVLELSIHLGRVPSSVGLGAEQRQTILTLTQVLPRLIPASWKWRLRADHSITLETRLLIDLPVSAVALVSELAAFLLQLDPYLLELDANLPPSAAQLH